MQIELSLGGVVYSNVSLLALCLKANLSGSIVIFPALKRSTHHMHWPLLWPLLNDKLFRDRLCTMALRPVGSQTLDGLVWSGLVGEMNGCSLWFCNPVPMLTDIVNSPPGWVKGGTNVHGTSSPQLHRVSHHVSEPPHHAEAADVCLAFAFDFCWNIA